MKSGGIAIRNPVVSAPLLHQCSVDACDILIKALQDGGGLNAEAHKACVKAAGNEARTAILKEEQANLDGMKGSGGRKVAKRLERMGETGAWLSVIPNRFDGTELSRGGFLNAAMDATNLSRWSTGSAVRRAALWDSGMTTYAKNWHTCARWP